jgi:hypothetical protein
MENVAPVAASFVEGRAASPKKKPGFACAFELWSRRILVEPTVIVWAAMRMGNMVTAILDKIAVGRDRNFMVSGYYIRPQVTVRFS